MSYILRPRVRRTQPPYPVLVDRDWFARGLKSAFLLSGPTPVDVASSAIGTVVSSIVPGYTPYGVTARHPSSGAGSWIDAGFTGSFIASTSGTIVWTVIPETAANAGTIRGQWGAITAGTNPEISAQIYTDNNWYVGWNNSVDARVIVAASAANWSVGVASRMALTWTAGAAAKLYCNGTLIGTAGSNTTVTAPSDHVVLVARDPSSAATFDQLGLLSWYYFDRELSTAEIQALADNEWQIFKPQQRRVYVSLAAAGSVLSAAGDSTGAFVGKAIANGVLSAAGDATAAFVGKALANGILSGAGDATASFTGKALASGVLSGAGDATANFVGRANAAAVWAAAADSTGSFVGTTGGNVLNAAGDSSAIFVGAELAAAVLAAAGEANATFVSLAIGGEQPSTRGYRGKRRLARGPRDDADAETVRKHYDLVELKKKQAKEKRAKAEARGPQPEPAIEPRPAAPEVPAPAPSAPETVSQKLERLEASVAEFQELRAEVLAARENAEILALMAIAIAAENH